MPYCHQHDMTYSQVCLHCERQAIQPQFPSPSKPVADSTLTGRKVGKVKMELVEEGFPHLYHSLATMMTWAGDIKGYKPHDWWNMPGGVEQFKAAEARHKNKRLRGEERDDESGLLHLVHEAFNAMAAAEVALRKMEGK